MQDFYLVIDGDAADRTRLADGLRTFAPGASVVEAETGAAALEALRAHGAAPSLVFSEFDLPDMNLIDLLGRLRSLAWLGQPPVVIVSESLSDRRMVDCYRLGASALLRKPVMAVDLRQAMAELGHRSSPRPLASPAWSGRHAA